MGWRPALRLLYTGLVQYGYDDAVAANAMAESIETTDSKFFRIRVKRGWTFHDGTPVTARSYVDASNYVAYGPNKMGNRTYLSKSRASPTSTQSRCPASRNPQPPRRTSFPDSRWSTTTSSR